jgi:hypothetical protein
MDSTNTDYFSRRNNIFIVNPAMLGGVILIVSESSHSISSRDVWSNNVHSTTAGCGLLSFPATFHVPFFSESIGPTLVEVFKVPSAPNVILTDEVTGIASPLISA